MVWKTWGELFNELIKRMELSFGKIATALSEYHDELSEEERSALKSINAENYVSLDAAAYWNFANNNRKPPPRERLLLFIHFFNRKLTGTKEFTFEEVKAFVKLAGLHELSPQECKVLFGHEQHQISELRDDYIHQVSDSNLRTDEALKSDVDEIKANIRRILRKQGEENTSNGVSLGEAGRLFDSLPTDRVPSIEMLPVGSRMPFGPSPLFVGRESDLKTLAIILKNESSVPIRQIAAVTGLGGIGKTQLAIEFVHRYGQFFAGGVYWLSFSDPASIMSEIAVCGFTMREMRADFDTFKLEEQVRFVTSAWESPLPRLLIFDNIDDSELLEQWRPKTGGSRILITSRRQQWDDSLNVRRLGLGILPRSESIELLRKFRFDIAENDPVLDDIAAELGDLPLALHLAGNYLKMYKHDIDPSQYLKKLRLLAVLRHPSLQHGDLSPSGHEQHVAHTFALSYERLASTDSSENLAREILARIGCFAPGQLIPRPLLIKSIELGSEDGRFQITDAISRLLNLGLIEADAEGNIIMHRLVLHFVQDVATELLITVTSAIELALFAEANYINLSGLPVKLVPWQVHLRYVTNNALKRSNERSAELSYSLGYFLKTIAEYDAAQFYLERALSICLMQAGTSHPYYAQICNSLGSLYQTRGDLKGAKSLLQEALLFRENNLGKDHLDTATSYNNFGMLLKDQGDFANAKAYLVRSLAIFEMNFGKEHSDTARSYNNLGMLLRDAGQYQMALSYVNQALVSYQAVLGINHPITAASYNNVGLLLYEMGDRDNAKLFYDQALSIRELTLGNEHPETAQSYNNLGMLNFEMGNIGDAELYIRKALLIREVVLGKDHPTTANSYNNLAGLLCEKGDLIGARICFEQALEICMKCFGMNHPITQSIRDNLTDL